MPSPHAYRYPMVPILALFAGAALAEAIGAVRARRLGTLLVPAAIAAAAVFVNWKVDDRDPGATTYASLGNAMAEAGQPGEGARMLAHAVDLSPEFGEAHLALGHLRSARVIREKGQAQALGELARMTFGDWRPGPGRHDVSRSR